MTRSPSLIRPLAALVGLASLGGCFQPSRPASDDTDASGTTTTSDASSTTLVNPSESSEGGATSTSAPTSDDAESSESSESSESTHDDADTSSESGSTTGDPVGCDPSAPFGSPEPLTPLDSAYDDRAAWSPADQLSVYFQSSRPGGAGGDDIYVATRDSLDEDFGAPVPIPGVNTPSHEHYPTLSADGLVLYASQWDGENWNVTMSTRPSTDVDFGPLVHVPVVNGVGYDADAEPGIDGAIYFTSDRTGNGDIYRASWGGAGFEAPVQVVGADIASNDYDGCGLVTQDELTMFFCSVRAGGSGGIDSYVATRASTNAPFGDVARIEELATPEDDYVTWVSADGCAIYLTRTEQGLGEMFVMRRGA